MPGKYTVQMSPGNYTHTHFLFRFLSHIHTAQNTHTHTQEYTLHTLSHTHTHTRTHTQIGDHQEIMYFVTETETLRDEWLEAFRLGKQHY